MTTDFRALCAELSDALRNAIRVVYHEDGTQHISTAMPILRRARAALADELAVGEPASVTGQPSDGELRDLWSWAAGQDQGPWPTQYHCFARAVLTRWGNLAPQPPAEGEVAELVGKLVEAAPALAEMGWDQHAQRILRAADLLQRLSPPQPVPVSERLSGPKDCDAEGRCWWFALETEVDFGAWTLGTPEACTGDNWGHTHWLPAYALPLPGQEVEG